MYSSIPATVSAAYRTTIHVCMISYLYPCTISIQAIIKKFKKELGIAIKSKETRVTK